MEKTYGELRDDRAKGAEKMASWLKGTGQKGKDLVQDNIPIDKNSIATKAGELVTDIGSSIAMPGGVATKGGNMLVRGGKLALDGGIQGAKFDIASKGEVTPESVGIGALGNTILGSIGSAYKGFKNITKTPTKVVDEIGNVKTPGVIFDKGAPVEITIPDTGKTKGVMNNLFDSTPESSIIPDKKGMTERMRLANRALMPSIGGKTLGQVMSQPKETEEAVKTLWTLHRTGQVEGSIDSLYEGAQAVQNGLEKYGKIIGDSIKKNGGKEIDMTDIWTEAKKIADDPIQGYAKAHAPLKAFTDAIEQGGGKTSITDLFEIKKIFQDQLGSLIKDGQMNSNAYKGLKDAVEKIGSKIDETVAGSNLQDETFKNAKNIYSQLKKIQPSIIKSAQVDARRSPMSLAEQMAWMQHNPMDWVTDPIGSVKGKAIKAMANELSNRTSRDGVFQQLMRIYDREASSNYDKIKNPIKNPAKTTMGEFMKKGAKKATISTAGATNQK